MSLLSDLALTYETLADDPIEVGIHYGKSVLKVLSGGAMRSETTLRSRLPAPVPRSNLALRSRMITRAQPTTSRRDYVAYNIQYRQTPAVTRSYQPRIMVGAL